MHFLNVAFTRFINKFTAKHYFLILREERLDLFMYAGLFKITFDISTSRAYTF